MLVLLTVATTAGAVATAAAAGAVKLSSGPASVLLRMLLRNTSRR